jgi:TNF receptor-associated factor 3
LPNWRNSLSTQIFPDNACRREILNLDVECSFSGCKWSGKLKDLEAHAAQCEFSEVQCKMCGNHVQKKSIAAHLKSDCPMRPELCVHCGKNVPYQQMQAHLSRVCPEVLRSCPNKCNPKLQMKLHELEKHVSLSEGDCPLSTMNCPYSVFSCNFVSLRKNIESHLQQYSVYHAQILAHHHSQLALELGKMRTTQQNQSERILALEQRASTTEKRLDTVEQRVKSAGDRSESTGRYSLTQDTQHAVVPYTGATGTGEVSLQQFEALSSKVTELDHSLDRCLSSSLDQELRLQLLERATFNGILLWRIDDFARRRREAVDGVTLSLYSTPFYTSRHGYKMCARVYLNGDGLGKGTHLSFFFVIMRGPFDALLTWPFKQKVMLTLINQVGKKHITDHFRPDPASSSFQRPGRKEMNIASGCPMFIRIDHLLNGGFIRDDSVFLRIVVDTSDLPKVVP